MTELLHRPLSMAAQTAYAELLDLALAAELSHSVASLTGNFATKSSS